MIEHLPEPPPPPRLNVGLTVVWSMLGLLTFLVVGSVVQMLQLGWGLWFSELVVFAGGTAVGFGLLQLSARRAVGLSRFEPKALTAGFLLGLVNYLAWAAPLMALAQAVFPKDWVEFFDSSAIFDRHSPIDLALVLAGVSIAAPLGEELFFRGMMQRGLALAIGGPRAIVVTAIIFSAFHLDPVGFLARFELGVLFGLLAWKSGSLWPAIGAHAANNALSSVLFLLSGDQKEEDLVWWAPVLLFVVGNAVMVAVARGVRPWLEVREPAAEREQRRTPWQVIGPWVGLALVLIGLVVALDWRGVALNAIDVAEHPDKATRQREDVRDIRRRARSGALELDAYRQALRTTAQTNE